MPSSRTFSFSCLSSCLFSVARGTSRRGPHTHHRSGRSPGCCSPSCRPPNPRATGTTDSPSRTRASCTHAGYGGPSARCRPRRRDDAHGGACGTPCNGPHGHAAAGDSARGGNARPRTRSCSHPRHRSTRSCPHRRHRSTRRCPHHCHHTTRRCPHHCHRATRGARRPTLRSTGDCADGDDGTRATGAFMLSCRVAAVSSVCIPFVVVWLLSYLCTCLLYIIQCFCLVLAAFR